MPWHTSDRVMTVRDRSRFVDVTVEMLDGWRRHLSGRNASLLAFFGFLSIFPLALAATTVLGFVLEGDEDLQERVRDGAFDEIPVLGQTLADDPTALSGNVWALVIGLLGALWSSTKVFVGVHGALDDTWEVPVDLRAPTARVRGRALIGIVILGGAQVGSIVLAAIVNAIGLPLFGNLGLIAATVVVNVAALGAMYRVLTSAQPAWRDVWLGATIAGIVFAALQHFGTAIVTYLSDNAGETYGTFALVLGLVTWLSFLSITALMCAELNAARVRLGDGSGVRRGPQFDIPITT